ncbi:MAG: glycosyltransferase family 4 protein, partial [Thermodesulfovibrionales bacterium]
SRLTFGKNIKMLMRAFELYRDRGGEWGLLIVGTGPQERELMDVAPSHISESICFYGWAAYDDIPSLYRGASCFILPSLSETWGLVVNEAMATGLPVLLSRKCGCLPDLCRTGENGFDFDPNNHEELAGLMLKMSSDEINLASMRIASKKIISNYTPETWANTIVEMVETLSKKMSWDKTA